MQRMTAQERAAESGKIANEIVSESNRKFLRAARKESLTITKLARRLNQIIDSEDDRNALGGIKLAGDWFGIKPVEQLDATVHGTIIVKAFGEDD